MPFYFEGIETIADFSLGNDFNKKKKFNWKEFKQDIKFDFLFHWNNNIGLTREFIKRLRRIK